jgi:uncharacterized RDD family membrane protein YckC
MLKKRIQAFLIDYMIILVYIGLLILSTLGVSHIFSISLENISPGTGQLVGFATLTLPVILYFTLTENSRYAGTPGKRKLALKVVSTDLSKAGSGRLLLRNCIKFLPWELAHFFVFRLFALNYNNVPVPGWVMTGLIASQALALVYLLMLFTKSGRSLYEILSATRVVPVVQY